MHEIGGGLALGDAAAKGAPKKRYFVDMQLPPVDVYASFYLILKTAMLWLRWFITQPLAVALPHSVQEAPAWPTHPRRTILRRTRNDWIRSR